MASAPPEAPESIMLQAFMGLRTNVAPERLDPGDLAIARNVDIDDVGQLRVRPGFERFDTAVCHSFRNIAGRALGVKDGVLGSFATDRTFTPLATVGNDPLSYAAVGDDIYASSVSWSGKISATNVVSAWGVANDPGEWYSPVMTPTDTLGAVAGRQLSAPPLSAIIETYRGRAYLAVGKVLWVTELYLYDKIDRTKGYVQFEHDITLVVAVEDGLYVGTTQGLYFLKGAFSDGLVLQLVLASPVLRGSAAWVPTTMVHPSARQQPLPEGQSVVLMTQAGVIAALDGGVVYNLTQTRVKLPALTAGAAHYRDDPGRSIYVYADEGGTAWAMNTRTGALTEYENYTFSGFARLGAEHIAGAADGLYVLDGVADDGVAIAVRARGGLMRFGGPRLSRLKGVYITARSGADLLLTIETGEGVQYVYDVASRVMRTMKVHMGKGQRATQFLFDLAGSDLDLDMLEFLPLVVARRV